MPSVVNPDGDARPRPSLRCAHQRGRATRGHFVSPLPRRAARPPAAPLDRSEQEQQNNNEETQSNSAAWVVAPAPAVRPRRHRPKQHHHEQDDKDGCDRHAPNLASLLRARHPGDSGPDPPQPFATHPSGNRALPVGAPPAPAGRRNPGSLSARTARKSSNSRSTTCPGPSAATPPRTAPRSRPISTGISRTPRRLGAGQTPRAARRGPDALRERPGHAPSLEEVP